MITAMVQTKLLATTAVTALVSTRIYVDGMPQNPTLPAITIHPVSGVPDKDVSKATSAQVQVSCWSNPAVTGGLRSPAQVETVAAAVRAVLHKPRLNTSPQRWTVGSVSYDIITCRCTGGVRLIDPGTNWYHIPVDVLIEYNEV